MITPYIMEIVTKKFKKQMDLNPIKNLDLTIIFDSTSEILLFQNEFPLSYEITDHKYLPFKLTQKLLIARADLWPERKPVVDGDEYEFVIVENHNMTDADITSGAGKTITYKQLLGLDLSKYSYYIPGSYFQPSVIEISEWTKLGFIIEQI